MRLMRNDYPRGWLAICTAAVCAFLAASCATPSADDLVGSLVQVDGRVLQLSQPAVGDSVEIVADGVQGIDDGTFVVVPDKVGTLPVWHYIDEAGGDYDAGDAERIPAGGWVFAARVEDDHLRVERVVRSVPRLDLGGPSAPDLPFDGIEDVTDYTGPSLYVDAPDGGGTRRATWLSVGEETGWVEGRLDAVGGVYSSVPFNKVSRLAIAVVGEERFGPVPCHTEVSLWAEDGAVFVAGDQEYAATRLAQYPGAEGARVRVQMVRRDGLWWASRIEILSREL